VNNHTSGGEQKFFHHKNARLTYARRVELARCALAAGAYVSALARAAGV
jgi:hypothetical protein